MHNCWSASASTSAWHVLRQLANNCCSLQVGPAHNPASLPRLDGLEVYARPKAEVVKEAAAAVEAEAAGVPSGNLSSNLNLAAISLPGHLVAQKAAQTCSNLVLSQGLLTLTSLHQLLAGDHYSCQCTVLDVLKTPLHHDMWFNQLMHNT